jgi:hypothetical protein
MDVPGIVTVVGIGTGLDAITTVFFAIYQRFRGCRFSDDAKTSSLSFDDVCISVCARFFKF